MTRLLTAALCFGLPLPERFHTTSALKVPAYTAVMKRIDCVCGHVVEAEDDDELWADAQEHLRTDHPDLVGKVSREDILAQAEET
jgi:predicted small metal-binding protein